MANRKKLKKYQGGGMSPVGLGASLLSGAMGGAGMGPLGMLGGAAISGYGAFMQNKAEQDMLAANEADRLTAEEEQARLMAEEKQRMDRQILEQFDVKGVMNPRFADGGGTDGTRSPEQLEGFRNAMKVDTRAGRMALDHEGFAKMMASLTPEELEMLGQKKAEITAQAEGLRGKGVGPALEMFSDLDLSFIKPLRERAGVSKSDLTDWTLDTLGVEGAARSGAKAAAWLKTYEHGGDTHPNTYNAEPQPNMPIGRELRHERGMPYYAPVDSPNGSIRQWEPGFFDYLGEAARNSFNPINIIGNADVQMRTDRYGGEGLMNRAGLNNRDKMYDNDPNDIFPDWIYGLAGVQPKMEDGGPTPGGTVTPEQARAAYTQPQFNQWNPSRWELFKEAVLAHNLQDDSTFENAVEMVDPTGISSWDDAYRANTMYAGTPVTADQTLDTIGALPLFGKGKAGFTLGKSTLAKFGQGFKNDMARGYNMLKQGANVLNVFDGLEDETNLLNGYALGGSTIGPKYEAEGGEMIQHQANDFPRTYGKGGVSRITPTESEIKGPSHAQGGVDMSDNKGARIYSDKLKVDSALMAKLSKL